MNFRRRGFTLIELLVVISIIALLMSILMPALRNVRDQAKSAMCMQILQQWGLIFSMYTDDNDGLFHGELGVAEESQGWVPALRPYYSGHKAGPNPHESRAERDIRLCPSAKIKFRSDGYVVGSDVAWGIASEAWSEGWGWAMEGDCGSYGLNAWVCNEEPWVADWWEEVGNLWRTPNVKGASNIPLLLDSSFFGSDPYHTDQPPEYDGDVVVAYNQSEMKRFCLNRHQNGTTNGVLWIGLSERLGLRSCGSSSGIESSTPPVRGPWLAASGPTTGPNGCAASKTTDFQCQGELCLHARKEDLH